MIIPSDKESDICRDCRQLRDFCGIDQIPESCNTRQQLDKERSREVAWIDAQGLIIAMVGLLFGVIMLEGFYFYSGAELKIDPAEIMVIRPNAFIGWLLIGGSILILIPRYGQRLLAITLAGPYILAWRYLISKNKKQRIKTWWAKSQKKGGEQ